MQNKFYVLPELGYDYADLVPFISEEQLKIHHQKHHDAYVKGANAIFEKLDQARQTNQLVDFKAEAKVLSFNIAGHILHSLFWENLSPLNQKGGNLTGEIVKKIEKDFGSFERFKAEFTTLSSGVEGSGWGALFYCQKTDRLICMQIEKHNWLVIPGFKLLLVVDVFEHAYYLDYKNERGKFLEAFWNIINWEKVNTRFLNIIQ